MHDSGKFVAGKRLDHGVNMVGHNAPSEQAVPTDGMAILAMSGHGQDARATSSRGMAILAMPGHGQDARATSSRGMAILAMSGHGQDARATCGVKVLKRAGHDTGDVISSHPALARARIEELLHAVREKTVQPRLFGGGQGTVHLLRCLYNVPALEFPGFHHRFGQ